MSTTEYIYGACICCYTAVTPDLVKGCRAEGEELCVGVKFCCAQGDEKINPGCGMIEDKDYICKLGAPCCYYGLKVPTVCVKAKGEMLCFKVAASLPFLKGFVDGPTCACCFFSCAPNVGFLQPPTKAAGAPATAVVDPDVIERA